MVIRTFNIVAFERDGEEDEYLTSCARIRNITMHALLKRLVKTIAKDHMVAAILDDAGRLQDRQKGEKRFRGDARRPPVA